MKILIAFIFALAVLPAYAAWPTEKLSARLEQALQASPAQAQADFVALISSGKPFTVDQLMDLINRGADVNARSFEGGRTALMVVAESVPASFVHLDSGNAADQRRRDERAQERRAAFARLAYLIQVGAEVNPRVDDGKNSPYLLLRVGGDSNVFSLLLEGLALQKGNPDLADDKGMRPIDLAAIQQKPAAYKLLCKAGADDNKKSPALGGKSPREYLQEKALQASNGDESFAKQFLEPFGY